MFHTGYEHSCTVVSQTFTDPRKLARPLDHGGPVRRRALRHLRILGP